MTEAFIGLGSNLGDKAANVRRAASLLGERPGVRVLAVSSLYATDPVGKVDQDWFVNAAVRVETGLDAMGLLEACLSVEREMGRVREERWGPRVIDLDVLLFGGESVDSEALRVPHPRMAEREFVMRPLAELAPGALVAGRRAADLLAALPGQGVRLLGER